MTPLKRFQKLYLVRYDRPLRKRANIVMVQEVEVTSFRDGLAVIRAIDATGARGYSMGVPRELEPSGSVRAGPEAMLCLDPAPVARAVIVDLQTHRVPYRLDPSVGVAFEREQSGLTDE